MKEIEELLDKMLLCSEEHLQSGVNEPTDLRHNEKLTRSVAIGWMDRL